MKKILTIMAIALVSSQAFAKVETTVEKSVDENGDEITVTTTTDTREVIAAKPGEHWYLNIGIGTQGYFGDNDYRAKFIDLWTAPAVEIYAGKWFTPVWGLHFGVSGYTLHGLSALNNPNAYMQTDKTYTGTNAIRYRAQSTYNIGAFFLADCNLINLFGGNRMKSIYDLTAGLGGGYLLGWDRDKLVHSPMICMELNNQFNITKHFGLYLKLAADLVHDQFDGEGAGISTREGFKNINNTPLDGIFSATIGATFAFGGREWTPASKKEVVRVTNSKAAAENAAALAASNAALAAAQNEKEALREQLEKLQKEYNTSEIKDMKVWYHVQFVIGKAVVSDRERVNLGAVAGFIKAQPERKFFLTGCADKQTASQKFNEVLAANRVIAVKDVLVNEFGVNPDQLVTESKGGVDLMFYQDNALSRCVIISSEK